MQSGPTYTDSGISLRKNCVSSAHNEGVRNMLATEWKTNIHVTKEAMHLEIACGYVTV